VVFGLAAVEGEHGLDILAVGAAFGAIGGGGGDVGLDLLIGLGGAGGIEADAGFEASLPMRVAAVSGTVMAQMSMTAWVA
jgi:hypothetical protein